jgi:cytochrome c6
MKTFVSLVILLGLMAVTRPAQAQDGAVLYKSKCQVCHGADGKGSPAGQKLGVKDFNAPDVAKETDAELATVTKKGKGKMPKYDGKLTDDQIAQVVKFIRSLK